MRSFGDTSALWAVVVIVVVPLAIIVVAELDERLRQRESALRSSVVTLRNWTLPFFAIWALLVPVLGLDGGDFVVRAAGTGLVLSIAVAVYGVIGRLVADVRSRPAVPGRRAVPQLVLALPKIATILVAAWLLVDDVWGVDLSAALTALGVTSLVISFALQDTLSGLAAGLLLLSDQPFQPGDWIRAGDVEGKVVDINWRTSRILTRDGDTVIVPNSELAGASVVNYSSPDALHRVVVSVQVAFHNPPTLAKAMLLDAARGTHGVVADPPPAVRVVQVDDPLMTYEVDMWIEDYAIAPRVSSDFGSLVWYQSHRHGVGLPSPAQDLFIYDGVTTAASSTPTTAELRARLAASPLLASLDDDQLDLLANAGHALRYAVGEELLRASAGSRDLVVLVDGTALLQLVGPDRPDVAVSDLRSGDVMGLLDGSGVAGRDLVIRAMTDCDVVIVDADVAGEVVSRSAALSAALNRITEVRRHRLERLLAADTSHIAEPGRGSSLGATDREVSS